jgi:hypothetical protein
MLIDVNKYLLIAHGSGFWFIAMRPVDAIRDLFAFEQ